MEGSSQLTQRQYVLNAAATMPYKILEWYQHDYVDNIAKLVVYQLCSKHCFALKKAAFFVNNPDFKWCRGIVGYASDEDSAILSNESTIIDFFDTSSFHAKTCAIVESAYTKNDTTIIKKCADILQMPTYHVCSIPLKYGNDGLFIYELLSSSDEVYIDMVQHLVALLGFCPLA